MYREQPSHPSCIFYYFSVSSIKKKKHHQFIFFRYLCYSVSFYVDVRGMDHVHHNHTYALGSEASGTSQRPVSRDKHRGDNSFAHPRQL